MRVQFSVFIEGENGRHIEMPIKAFCLEDLDKTIARNYNDYQDLRRKILNYHNNKYIIPITQYPEIKMIVYDGKKQRTENYRPIYDYINSKKVASKAYETINSNPKERYPNDFSKQNIVKNIEYIISHQQGELSYKTIRQIYFELKKLGILVLSDTPQEELLFDKEKYQIIINGFETGQLVCMNKKEFPYIYNLKEQLKLLINKNVISNEDVMKADQLIEEIMKSCYWIKVPTKTKKKF